MNNSHMIQIKRSYAKPDSDDGIRILVDRIWPRGIKKEDLKPDEWLKEIAPSDELRKWFGHDVKKWGEFQRCYFAELDDKPEMWKPILEAIRKGKVTLLFSAKDERHNNALALKAYLEKQLNHDS
jgi:uncharacterized protein YeaO (DUF488 family)